MIIRREAFTAALNAVTTNPLSDKTQYFLRALEVRPDARVTATNGHVLISVHDTTPYADADFPTKDIPATTEPTAPVLLDVPHAERLIKGTSKRARAPIPILSAIKVGRSGTTDTVFASANDLEVPTIVRVPDDNRKQFPDWERIVPTPKTFVTLRLSTEYLRDLCKAADAIQDKGTCSAPRTLVFEVPTDGWSLRDGAVDASVRVTAISSNGNGLELTAVIMPVCA